jgi:hypothetical protein
MTFPPLILCRFVQLFRGYTLWGETCLKVPQRGCGYLYHGSGFVAQLQRNKMPATQGPRLQL